MESRTSEGRSVHESDKDTEFQDLRSLLQVHMLYLNRDRTLHDCNDIESGDIRDSELVQDYKRLSRKYHQTNGHSHGQNGRSKRNPINNKPSKPKQFLYTRSDSSGSSEDEDFDK